MNPETANLVERPSQDIVDDLLTAIVGGVTNEPIIFDVKETLYRLSRPATDVRGITGTFEDPTVPEGEGERHHSFQKEIDFVFSEGDNAVVWQDGGKWPKDDTTFHVDYFIPDSPSPITDLNVGSVTRTLTEAIARETAIVYEQINEAYRSGFVDTAKGKALDLVVSIVGIERLTKEYAVGLATFFRDAGADGNVTIPQATIVTTAKAEVQFETTSARTLQRGQARIDVPIRATRGSRGPAGKVDSGRIVDVFQPISGISSVSNFDATILGADDETDEQLRERAKAVLASLGKATLAALVRVILEGKGRPSEVWDANTPGPHQSLPGTVSILVEAEPARMPSLQGAVHETRAAGVQATLLARYVFFKPRLAVTVRPGISAPGKEKVVAGIIAALGAYVDTVASGGKALGDALLSAAKTVDGVQDIRVAEVVVWRSDLGHAGAAGLADAVVEALTTAPADEAGRRQAIEAALVAESPALVPTGRRVPDRTLVEAATGGPVSDADIDAGTFAISATVDGDPWWLVLDLAPADIAVREV